MFRTLSSKGGGVGIALAAVAMSSFYGCSKREAQDVQPAITQTSMAHRSDTAGTATWNSFVSLVEAGKIKDPQGQYVSKSTRVVSDGTGARPTRPKGDATKRTIASLYAAAASSTARGTGPSPYLIDCPECGGNGGGGGSPVPVPSTTKFISTEMVLPYDTPPRTRTAGSKPTTAKGPVKTNGFYTTENPNGYVYDLKIVKAATVPFNNNPYYYNIVADLNEGAGGDYIYLSFTRDPSHVEYERFGAKQCGTNGDEQPRSGVGPAAPYLNLPITEVDTEVHCCVGYQFSSCYISPNTNLNYFPMYAKRISAPINSDYMTVQDLNDAAGGSYVYGYLTRTPIAGRKAVEVGVLTGNTEDIQPPIGWKKVGTDLNRTAGGKFIYFCTKARQ